MTVMHLIQVFGLVAFTNFIKDHAALLSRLLHDGQCTYSPVVQMKIPSTTTIELAVIDVITTLVVGLDVSSLCASFFLCLL